LDLPGATLFETVYRHPVLEPLHEHPHPYVAVLLKGNYREAYRRGEAHFDPFTAVFHPANAQHSCVLNEPGCRFFTLELETSWIQSMHTMVQANSVFDWHGERLLWLMLRLLREFRDRRARLPLTMESLILEMLAALGYERHIGPRLPLNRWKIL